MSLNIWEWNQGYIEHWSNNRVVPANFEGVLMLTDATGFPPGYHVSDGVTNGGVYPTNQTPSNYPILMWPENNGIGPYCFESQVTMTIQNTSTSTAFFYASLGVAYPSGPVPANQPMWPWLGTSHDADDPLSSQGPLWTLGQREVKPITIHRMDVVSNLFEGPGGNPPLWPTWQMDVCQTSGISYLMYPAVCISVRTTSEPVTVGAINCISRMRTVS